MSEWHGWFIAGNHGLCIGQIPGRKSLALYKMDAGGITVLAWFCDEAAAREVLRLLDLIAGGKEAR